MKRTQADAMAQAILEPDIRAQEELRAKRAKEAADLTRQRRVAWFTLVGAGLGSVAAYFGDYHFSQGILYGGLTGTAIGWLIRPRSAA